MRLFSSNKLTIQLFYSRGWHKSFASTREGTAARKSRRRSFLIALKTLSTILFTTPWRVARSLVRVGTLPLGWEIRAIKSRSSQPGRVLERVEDTGDALFTREHVGIAVLVRKLVRIRSPLARMASSALLTFVILPTRSYSSMSRYSVRVPSFFGRCYELEVLV